VDNARWAGGAVAQLAVTACSLCQFCKLFVLYLRLSSSRSDCPITSYPSSRWKILHCAVLFSRTDVCAFDTMTAAHRLMRRRAARTRDAHIGLQHPFFHLPLTHLSHHTRTPHTMPHLTPPPPTLPRAYISGDLSTQLTRAVRPLPASTQHRASLRAAALRLHAAGDAHRARCRRSYWHALRSLRAALRRRALPLGTLYNADCRGGTPRIAAYSHAGYLRRVNTPAARRYTLRTGSGAAPAVPRIAAYTRPPPCCWAAHHCTPRRAHAHVRLHTSRHYTTGHRTPTISCSLADTTTHTSLPATHTHTHTHTHTYMHHTLPFLPAHLPHTLSFPPLTHIHTLPTLQPSACAALSFHTMALSDLFLYDLTVAFHFLSFACLTVTPVCLGKSINVAILQAAITHMTHSAEAAWTSGGTDCCNGGIANMGLGDAARWRRLLFGNLHLRRTPLQSPFPRRSCHIPACDTFFHYCHITFEPRHDINPTPLQHA